MRKSLLFVLVVSSGAIFTIRLLSLQVFSSDYESQSLQNSVLKEYIYPERGFIYDRNGTLIVENQPTYDLMVVPKQLKQIDTIEFCNLLKVDKKFLDFEGPCRFLQIDTWRARPCARRTAWRAG